MVKLNVGFFIHPFRIKNISCWLPKTEQFQSDHVSLGSTRRSFRQYQGFNRYMVRKLILLAFYFFFLSFLFSTCFVFLFFFLSFSHCLVSFYCFNLPFFIFSLNNWSVVLKITPFFIMLASSLMILFFTKLQSTSGTSSRRERWVEITCSSGTFELSKKR